MTIEEFPGILRQYVFYRKDKIARGLNKIQVNPLNIKDVDYEPVKRGLFDRKGLYFIKLKDEAGVGIGYLFAKVNYSHLIPNSGQTSIREESLSSQFRHLDFLNNLRLPVVEVVGYHGEVKGTQDDHTVLLMKRFQAPTMDRDILALDKLRKEQAEIVENSCGPTEEIDRATNFVADLSKLRENLILSALGAVNHISIYGTLYSLNRTDLAYEPSTDYFTKKLERRLHLFLLHTLIKTGVIERGDVTNGLGLVDDKLAKLKELIAPFNIIERLMRDKRTMAYTHGDEYPHHVYFETNGGIIGHEIDDLGTKAKLFDFSFCMRNSLVRSKAAFLGSPILGLSFSDAQRLFLESQKEALGIAKTLKGDVESGIDGLVSGFEDEKFSLKMFSLLYLYEQFTYLGLIASDDLFNPYFGRESKLDIVYKPSIPSLQKHVSEREERGGVLNISLDRYSQSNTLKITRANIEDCLHFSHSGLIDEESKLFDAVRGCLDYLAKFPNIDDDKPLKSPKIVEHIHNHTNPPLPDHERNGPPGFSSVADTQELPNVEPSVVKNPKD